MMATVAVAVAAKKAALADKLLESSRGIGQELDQKQVGHVNVLEHKGPAQGHGQRGWRGFLKGRRGSGNGSIGTRIAVVDAAGVSRRRQRR